MLRTTSASTYAAGTDLHELNRMASEVALEPSYLTHGETTQDSSESVHRSLDPLAHEQILY